MDGSGTGAGEEAPAFARTEADRRLSGLMAAAQTGDGAAYTALLREAAVLLRRLVRSRRRSASASDVEDLVQDVLLSVHAVRSTYDPSRPFTPWLTSIARNRLADGARRHGRDLARAALDYDVGLSLYPEHPPDAERPEADALRQAIDGLPARQRQAIELTKLQDMSLDEASRATGASVGALKLLVHRAMRNLRRSLGQSDGTR